MTKSAALRILCVLLIAASGLASITVTPAVAREPIKLTVLHSHTGLGAVPAPASRQDLVSQYLDEFARSHSRALEVISYDTESNPAKVVYLSERARGVDGAAGIILSPRWTLVLLNRRGMLGPFGGNNPFTNIPESYKQFTTSEARDPRKAFWIALGWIQKNWPGLEITESADGTHVITIEEGHPGWPLYGLGIFENGKPEEILDALMDWAASADSNAKMGDWFWVIPDNSKLGRRVRIDLVDEDGKTIASSPCDSKVCMPTPAAAKVTVIRSSDEREYTVCGTAAACPSFVTTPEYELRVDELAVR